MEDAVEWVWLPPLPVLFLPALACPPLSHRLHVLSWLPGVAYHLVVPRSQTPQEEPQCEDITGMGPGPSLKALGRLFIPSEWKQGLGRVVVGM